MKIYINSQNKILLNTQNRLLAPITYYSITPTLTNVTASQSNPSVIQHGGSATLTFTANEGYELPDTVSVSGATSTWNKNTGTLILSNAENDVTFSITGILVELTELCFTANQANSTVELTVVGAPSIANTAYSRDRITWTSFTPSTTKGTNTITLTNIGDKVYFRNDITDDLSYYDYMHFVMSGSISASGNCNSIYDSINFENLTALVHEDCYYDLFYNCTSLTKAPDLPATELSFECYYEMFYDCTSLTTAPELPATNIEINCYMYMFAGCSSLVVPPELPATEMCGSCYFGMFHSCTSLTVAPALPADILDLGCYHQMFFGCTSLVTVPNLPATELMYECYYDMFTGCTSLYVSDTQTPQAPYSWRLPTSNTFVGASEWQVCMFENCLGTRSSDDMPGEEGESYTYYTQNEPI